MLTTLPSPAACAKGQAQASSLTVPLFVLGLIVSVALGLFVAFFRETYIDRAVLVLCMLTMSITALLYIIAGQYLIGMLLQWFPISGFDADPLVIARFLALPVLVGVVAGFGPDTRFYRTIFVEEMSKDYVRTARAKGCGDMRVMVAHVLRNALIPILTERRHGDSRFCSPACCCSKSFFGIPGLGSLTVEAIQGNDFSMLRTMVYLGALLFILGQILTDISYAIADPRVRLRLGGAVGLGIERNCYTAHRRHDLDRAPGVRGDRFWRETALEAVEAPLGIDRSDRRSMSSSGCSIPSRG